MTTEEFKKKLVDEIKQRQKPLLKKIGTGALNFAKGIGQSAIQDLIVTPGTRIGQAAAYGIGAATHNERIKANAFKDTQVNLGPLGSYNNEAIRPGLSGAGQIGGQALKAASFLYTPGRAAGAIAQQSLKQAAIQGAKAGALGVGSYTLGQGIEQKNFKLGETLLNTGVGAGIGAVTGGVLGAGGYGVGKLGTAIGQGEFKNPKIVELQNKWQELQRAKLKAPNQSTFDRYAKAQKNVENKISQLSQAGFIKNPFAKEEPKALPPEQTTNLAKTEKLPAAQKIGQSLSNPEKVSSFYNLDKLNISKDAKNAIQGEIDNAGKQLEKTVGKTLSNKEVLDLASNSSKILSQTVTREQTANKIAADLKLRQQIAKVAQDGKIDKNFVSLWLKDKSAGEDIARQLQARKIGADPRSTELIDSLLQAIYKVNKNADDIAAAAKNVDFNNPTEVAKFYRQFVKPKASEWLDLVRYNSMLTSPNTHIINTASNFEGTGIIAPIEKTITGMIDATRSALTGQPRQYAVGEGTAYAKGYYSNLKAATEKFTSVMRGESLISQPDIRRIPLATSGVKAGVEKTLNLPLRLLEGMDQFFKTLTEGGLQSAGEYAASKNINRGTNMAEEASSRLFRGQLKAEQQGYVLNAIDDITGLVMKARNSDNPITSTIAKFTLPFVRTPMEILKQGIEYSPMGVSTLVGATNKMEQLSKIIIGTSAAAGAATLLGQDRLTWAAPTNAKQRAEFDAAGRQAYSVKIGNKWISYSKLHPALAFNFALIAAVDDAQKNKGLGDSEVNQILSAVAKWGNFFADQSYLKNIGDFVAATKGDAGGYSKLVSNYPQQLIPFRALSSWLERLTDPSQRKADPNGTFLEKQVQQVMLQIPGIAQKLPAKTGPFGAPIPNQNRIINAFSPNKVNTTDKGYESLFQLNQSKRSLTKIKSNIRDMIKQEIQQRMLQTQ
jgi:hypothetical protein